MRFGFLFMVGHHQGPGTQTHVIAVTQSWRGAALG